MRERCLWALLGALLMAGWPLLRGAEAEDPPKEAVVLDEARRITFKLRTGAEWKAKSWHYKTSGYGAAIGFRRDGWLLTTSHQIVDEKKLVVECPDGAARVPDIWLWSTEFDVGLVHIPDYEVPVPRTRDSASLRVGETAWTYGHPHNFDGSLTRGTVSGLHRLIAEDGVPADSFQDYVQTDAQANPGNSGGPLLDDDGRLIGLVCASLSALKNGSPGMSFALPSEIAARVGDRLIKERDKIRSGTLAGSKVDIDGLPLEIRKRHGIEGRDGVLMFKVRPEDAKQGLQVGDVIRGVGNRKIHNWMNLRTRLALEAPGTEVTLRLTRQGKPMDVKLTLASWKDNKR